MKKYRTFQGLYLEMVFGGSECGCSDCISIHIIFVLYPFDQSVEWDDNMTPGKDLSLIYPAFFSIAAGGNAHIFCKYAGEAGKRGIAQLRADFVK